MRLVSAVAVIEKIGQARGYEDQNRRRHKQVKNAPGPAQQVHGPDVPNERNELPTMSTKQV